MGDVSDLQKGQIVGARLAGASVAKTATSLGVSIAAVPKVTTATHITGRRHQLRENSGQKPKYSESDRRTLKKIVSKSHKPTASKVTAGLNIHYEDPVSTKNSPKRALQIQHPR